MPGTPNDAPPSDRPQADDASTPPPDSLAGKGASNRATDDATADRAPTTDPDVPPATDADTWGPPTENGEADTRPRRPGSA